MCHWCRAYCRHRQHPSFQSPHLNPRRRRRPLRKRGRWCDFGAGCSAAAQSLPRRRVHPPRDRPNVIGRRIATHATTATAAAATGIGIATAATAIEIATCGGTVRGIHGATHVRAANSVIPHRAVLRERHPLIVRHVPIKPRARSSRGATSPHAANRREEAANHGRVKPQPAASVPAASAAAAAGGAAVAVDAREENPPPMAAQTRARIRIRTLGLTLDRLPVLPRAQAYRPPSRHRANGPLDPRRRPRRPAIQFHRPALPMPRTNMSCGRPLPPMFRGQGRTIASSQSRRAACAQHTQPPASGCAGAQQRRGKAA
jgi:hypothetical protein